MKTRILFLLAALGLAACAGEPARLSVGSDTSAMTIRSQARSVLIGEVALPEYAGAAEVLVQNEDGLIEVVPDVVWADTPSDALANALVRNLSRITGARVAASPWPLEEIPDAEVTVRTESMLVRADQRLEMTGQFAVRREEGVRPERLRSFDIIVPIASFELKDIAAGHAAAWKRLAEEIAAQL